MHIFLEYFFKLSLLEWIAITSTATAFTLAIMAIVISCGTKRHLIHKGLLCFSLLCCFWVLLLVGTEVKAIKDINNYISDGEYQQAINIAQDYGLKDEEYEVLCLYADHLYKAEDFSSALDVYEKIENYDIRNIDVSPLDCQEEIENCKLKVLENDLKAAYDKAIKYQKEGNAEKSDMYFRALRYGEIE